MSYSSDQLDRIFYKTGERCRCCSGQIVRVHYGLSYMPGAWEVDHAIPVSRNGSDHESNLWPMCPNCNQRKGDYTWDEFKGSCPSPVGW